MGSPYALDAHHRPHHPRRRRPTRRDTAVTWFWLGGAPGDGEVTVVTESPFA
jgi:hypothetical protein